MLRSLAPLCRSALLPLDTLVACSCGSFASTPASSTTSLPPAAAGAAAAGLSTSVTAAASTSYSSSSSSSGGGSTSSSSSSSTSGRWRTPGMRAANAPLAAPWTPTSMLVKRKTYQKRSRFLMSTLEAEQQRRLASDKQIPKFSSGDILEVQTVVPEADRKVYTFKGVCVARANKGPRSWFKLYNVFPDAGGFVQHFPLYMPDLLSIKVVGRLPRAKRSKLYHILQDESPKHIYQAGVEVQQS